MSKKILFLFILTLAACGKGNDPYQPLTSGIDVQVLIGPTCPVVQEGMECADKPYQATLSVLDLDREEIIKFETDKDGKYTVNLQPGDYILRAENPTGMPSSKINEQNFTVLPDKITQLTVTFDSGIR